jgi:hypothetical protein
MQGSTQLHAGSSARLRRADAPYDHFRSHSASPPKSLAFLTTPSQAISDVVRCTPERLPAAMAARDCALWLLCGMETVALDQRLRAYFISDLG